MLKFFRRSKKDPKSELRDLLGDFELPSFPGAVMNVLSALRDPDFSMKKIAEQLQVDPGLHVKVLKTVNSAAFGFSTRVKNLHHAITLLGRSRLEAVVLSQAVKTSLPAVKLPFFDMKRFWLSAAKRASLARTIANRFHPATQVECFTTGLLLDMGLPVLINAKSNQYSVIMDRWYSEEDSLLDEIERETFNYDHTVIGSLMAEEWNLPDYLINTISEHHTQDSKAQIDPAIKVVSYISIRDEDEEKLHKKIIDSCVNEFGIEEGQIKDMISNAFEDAEGLSQMFI